MFSITGVSFVGAPSLVESLGGRELGVVSGSFGVSVTSSVEVGGVTSQALAFAVPASGSWSVCSLVSVGFVSMISFIDIKTHCSPNLISFWLAMPAARMERKRSAN